MTTDEQWMLKAIEEAKKGWATMEVPIGAVIVYEGKLIGQGYNQRNTKKSTLSHGELIAIEAASKYMGDWRLEGCTMYVTVEPCPMCAGAILQARMDRVVIGTMNKKAGCVGSVYNLLEEPRFNHQVVCTYGVLEKVCAGLMSDFFKKLRKKL